LSRLGPFSENTIVVGDCLDVPDGGYKTILADPPWKYGKGWGWGAGEYYPLMTVNEIASLIIPIADNAHLYLWSPNAMLPNALRVMNAWGFDYKTCVTWVKTRSIFGYYFKGQTEHLLFGLRGSLPPMDRRQVTVIFADIGRHSEKPTQAYEAIEAVSPPPYLELFARKKRGGWDAWGNEIA